jgi:hypothetical protein
MLYVEKQFRRIGAEIEVETREEGEPFSIDVREDRYLLRVRTDAEVEVLAPDVRPKERHLLLFARSEFKGDKRTTRMICGHDERHWFVADVTGNARVNSVASALESLKPIEVRMAQRRARLDRKNWQSRRNEAFVRQGEWFFLPRADLIVDRGLVLRHEPISRGGRSKPHIVEELYRTGGRGIYVGPQGKTLSVEQFRRKSSSNPNFKAADWRLMRVGMEAYARGAIRHRDHKTIQLPYWHRIVMNSESVAPGRGPVLFID